MLWVRGWRTLTGTDRQVAPQTTLGWLRGSHQKRVVLRKGREDPLRRGHSELVEGQGPREPCFHGWRWWRLRSDSARYMDSEGSFHSSTDKVPFLLLEHLTLILAWGLGMNKPQ